MSIIFLARVPIVFLLALILLPTLTFFGGLQPTVRGLFTLDYMSTMFLVGLAAFSLALGATASINLVNEHAPERMNSGGHLAVEYAEYSPPVYIYLLCQIPAWYFVACCLRNWSGSWFEAAAAIIGAWLFGHVLLAAAVAVEVLLADPNSRIPNLLVLPLPKFLVNEGGLLTNLLNSDPLPMARRAADAVASLLAHYALPLLPGYIYRSHGEYKLYPGMLFNGAFSLFGFVTWGGVIIGVAYAKHFYGSLAFVLLAMLVFMLLLAGAAFFLDRYRIPLSLAVLTYVLVFGGFSATDHLYRVEKGPVMPFVEPSEVLNSGNRSVVIMTAGGGIQAAAWTTQVLEGLRKSASSRDIDFPSQILLISSVSGGSVGAYYIAVAFHKQQDPKGDPLEQARKWALESSLDEIAWGFMGPDLVRLFLPYASRPELDRGRALEDKWDSIAQVPSDLGFFLDELAEDTHTGKAPAFIMNATAIEDGAPFIFATTAFHPDSNDPAALRDVKEFNLQNHYQGRIRVSTAARLSASFPYVAPAARSNAHPLAPDYHIVDGGYYDNYGIRSALDWLDQASPVGTPKPKKIAFVEILWGDPGDSGGSIRGWNYQSYAPLSGVLSVRDKGQFREDQVALLSFRPDWKDVVAPSPFKFVYEATGDCSHQPISWKLTEDQAKCVESTWETSQKVKSEADRLMSFLK